jgi:hypothetical protein
MNRILRGAIFPLIFCVSAFGGTSVGLNADWLFRIDPN